LSPVGFRECQITRILKTFLLKEMATKGSMSQPVRVTKYIQKQNRLSVRSVGMYKGLGEWETHCF
jgi:hypothetical protein